MNRSDYFTRNIVTPFLRYMLGWVMGILSYEALLEVGVFCFVFSIVGWINYSNGAPNVNSVPALIPILKLFGIGQSKTFGTEDIKSLVSQVIMVLGLIGMVLHFLVNRLVKIELRINGWRGLGIIMVFFMFSLISCFSPTAKTGAGSIVPVLGFFLLLSLFSYGRHLFFQILSKWIYVRRKPEQSVRM